MFLFHPTSHPLYPYPVYNHCFLFVLQPDEGHFAKMLLFEIIFSIPILGIYLQFDHTSLLLSSHALSPINDRAGKQLW